MTDSESEADDDTTEGTVRGMGEEEYLGTIGSSGEEWSGVERGGGITNSLNSIGRGTKVGTTRSNYKPKRDRV